MTLRSCDTLLRSSLLLCAAVDVDRHVLRTHTAAAQRAGQLLRHAHNATQRQLRAGALQQHCLRACLTLSSSDTWFSKFSTRLCSRLKFQSARLLPCGTMPLRAAEESAGKPKKSQSSKQGHTRLLHAGQTHRRDACGCGRSQVRAAACARSCQSSQNDTPANAACASGRFRAGSRPESHVNKKAATQQRAPAAPPCRPP